mgnify:CR=1 FL=1
MTPKRARRFGPIAPPPGLPVRVAANEAFLVPLRIGYEKGEELGREHIQSGLTRPADSHKADIEGAQLVWVPLWRVDAAVDGDSAGGTLAAVCAALARDAGLDLALQLLIYPGTSAHQDSPSQQRYAQGLVLERAAIDWFFGHYLNTPADREDWRFAPLLLPDAQGLAPAHVCLAELDPMVDEGVDYADLLRMAGVPVSLEIYKGVTHEFIKMGRAIPEARQAQHDIAQALRQAFAIDFVIEQ